MSNVEEMKFTKQMHTPRVALQFADKIVEVCFKSLAYATMVWRANVNLANLTHPETATSRPVRMKIDPAIHYYQLHLIKLGHWQIPAKSKDGSSRSKDISKYTRTCRFKSLSHRGCIWS